jgi:hypothetical protein
MGPFGGGKSVACVMDIATRGTRQAPGQDGVRRSKWCVVRQSYRQLEDSTMKTVFQWFPPHICGDWAAAKHNFTIKSLRAGPNEPSAEIELCFRALDRPDQASNLLSTEYTGGWINEGRDVQWPIWEALLGRIGRYPAMKDGGPSWFGLISDTNPPDTDSDWYRFFEDADHSEAIEKMNDALAARVAGATPMTVDSYRALFKQPSGLGPQAENLSNLIPAYYERQAIGKSDDWVKVYLKGEYGFTVDGLPVFPEYSDDLHCPSDKRKMPKTLEDMPIYRSYDFGLTPACVFSQITPGGQWIVVDELVATSMGFDRFSDEVIEHSNIYYPGSEFIDLGDPAGNQRSQTDERTCFEIAWNKDIAMQAAPQSPLLRQEGTRKALRTLVSGRPQFALHPRCKKLRKALLGGYHFKRKKTAANRYEEKPDKNEYSHVADALTYAGAWLFGQGLRTRPFVDEDGGRSALVADMTRSAETGY